jgi:hypothetical protein
MHRILAAVVAGACAGGAGSLGWAALGAATLSNCGYLAWLLGLLIGATVAAAARERSFRMGAVALALAAGGMVYAELHLAAWTIEPWLRRAYADADPVLVDAAMQNEAVREAFRDHAASRPTDETSRRRLLAAFLRRNSAPLARQMAASMSPAERAETFTGGYEFVWWLLGVASAYAVAGTRLLDRLLVRRSDTPSPRRRKR